MWFYETLFPYVKLGIKGELICHKKTQYQDLKIYNTPQFGKVLVLDGANQTSEKDEFIYHEMITHPVLLAHPNPKKILVIGAGDGGVLREVLKHNVEKIFLVEIDKAVIEVAKKYLLSINKRAFEDKRVEVVINDGAKFIKETKEKFDVAIVDSSDPIGPAKVLFSENFYKNIYSVLNTPAIMIRQTGSTFFQPKEVIENYKLAKKIFSDVVIQLASIPLYIGGFFSFIIATKKINYKKIPLKTIEKRYKNLKLNTKYYNPEIHFASLVLPNFLREVR